MASELLRHVRILDPVSRVDRQADVLLVDGRISAIEAAIAPPDNTQIQDGTGLILATGLVDLYSHSGEPGFESRETLDSWVQSAIVGGFTRLNLLPNTDPALDNPTGLEWVRSRLLQLPLPQSLPQVGLWGALTIGAKGEQMAELADLAAAGVVGFADSQPLQSRGLIRRLLEYAKPLRQPIALWCCDRGLAGNGVVRDGIEALRLGLPTVPAMAETAALAALLECVAELNVPVHLMRVSTARSVELIAAAKERGLPITASTTWLHVLLDIAAVYSYDPSLRLDPPLGNPDDRQALRTALKSGVLDAIAIDHTPYTYEEKTVAFSESPPGAIGLELALPLLWQALVETGEWSALDLWRCLSSNAAACLHQSMNPIAPGQPAELVLFDPQQSWQVTPQTLRSRSSNTPWLGKTIEGRVVKIWTGFS